MTKQKVGSILFWIAIIWTFIWLVIGWAIGSPTMRNLTPEEINQTIWILGGPFFFLSGIAIPLGALLAGIGILLYSDAKGSTVLFFGIGIFLVIIVSMSNGLFGHFPLLFGIGGTLILLSFTGILWLWAKERRALKGSSTAASDYKLVGYVFMLIAAWFICGLGSMPFWKAFEGQPKTSPIHIMILLLLGWLFLFLSHYKSREQQG